MRLYLDRISFFSISRNYNSSQSEQIGITWCNLRIVRLIGSRKRSELIDDNHKRIVEWIRSLEMHVSQLNFFVTDNTLKLSQVWKSSVVFSRLRWPNSSPDARVTVLLACQPLKKITKITEQAMANRKADVQNMCRSMMSRSVSLISTTHSGCSS